MRRADVERHTADWDLDLKVLAKHMLAMDDVLRAVEWEGLDRDGMVGDCLVCSGDEYDGHAPDCALRAALLETE